MTAETRAVRCAVCQTEEGVKLRSPDMDIEAMPFCPICWFELMNPLYFDDLSGGNHG